MFTQTYLRLILFQTLSWGEVMISANVFYLLRIVLFFFSTYMVFRSLQAIDLSRLFKPNSTGEIRTVFLVLSVSFGYLFTTAIISLFEYLNSLLGNL